MKRSYTIMPLNVELLVEEPSMEAFLQELLPRMLPPECTFKLQSFQGENDLLQKLEKRLCGYQKWLPSEWRIVVVVDQDNDDCQQLKNKMEHIAQKAGLRTRSQSPSCWQLVNRIAVEELEAWYFGDWKAVQHAYPKVPSNIPLKQRYRNSDAITGGTWEALEQILQKKGYFMGGLPKIEVARTLGKYIDPNRCPSKSFCCFRDAIYEAINC